MNSWFMYQKKKVKKNGEKWNCSKGKIFIQLLLLHIIIKTNDDAKHKNTFNTVDGFVVFIWDCYGNRMCISDHDCIRSFNKKKYFSIKMQFLNQFVFTLPMMWSMMDSLSCITFCILRSKGKHYYVPCFVD